MAPTETTHLSAKSRCHVLQVNESLKLHTSDNVSVITVCLTEHAPPARTFSGRLSVQRSISQDGLSRIGSALMDVNESRIGV